MVGKSLLHNFLDIKEFAYLKLLNVEQLHDNIFFYKLTVLLLLVHWRAEMLAIEHSQQDLKVCTCKQTSYRIAQEEAWECT